MTVKNCVMTCNKNELRDYLVERLILDYDKYEIGEITSLVKRTNPIGNPYLDIVIKITICGDRKFTDNVCIDYQSFIEFKIRNRKKKLERIIDGIQTA